METPAIGFIGFGEAGSTIAAGLRGAGADRLIAFDIHSATPGRGEIITARAAAIGVPLAASSAELVEASDVVFSTVTSSAALDAAVEAAPSLRPRHLYADLNSVSPALKQTIAARIEAGGARFVEAAVMAPVGPDGHRVPMLLGGSGGPAFVAAMAAFGMRLEVISGQVGQAAAVKMCRSIVVKGLEALLMECVLGASRFGADDLVFASLQESYPGLDWKALADYTANRVAVHGERRAREMEEVAETLRASGVEPIMAEAVARRQDWSACLNLQSKFGPEGPSSYREVVEAAFASRA